jgi:hypothetical protein
MIAMNIAAAASAGQYEAARGKRMILLELFALRTTCDASRPPEIVACFASCMLPPAGVPETLPTDRETR